LLVLTLALVAGGSWYAMRIGQHKSQAVASPGFADAQAAAPPADGRLASETAEAPADKEAGSPPTLATVLEGRDAAPTDIETKSANTVEPEAGSRVADGEMPNQAVDLAQAAPTEAIVAIGELGERCRKTDAGGRGKPMAVWAACRPAIEAEPEAADLMVILARVAIDRGRAAEARVWAKKALAIRHDLPDAYVFLGGAEQGLGRPAEAKAAYKKYLELAPSGRHASELRAVLRSL
jgi:tetratricopeptide (TPR) repeat protein